MTDDVTMTLLEGNIAAHKAYKTASRLRNYMVLDLEYTSSKPQYSAKCFLDLKYTSSEPQYSAKCFLDLEYTSSEPQYSEKCFLDLEYQQSVFWI